MRRPLCRTVPHKHTDQILLIHVVQILLSILFILAQLLIVNESPQLSLQNAHSCLEPDQILVIGQIRLQIFHLRRLLRELDLHARLEIFEFSLHMSV